MDTDTPRKKFPFFVQRYGDRTLVAMECGRNRIVGRSFTGPELGRIARFCRALAETAYAILQYVESTDSETRLLKGHISGLRVTFDHGDERGMVMIMHDDQDIEPFLILTDDQIEEFWRLGAKEDIPA